MTHVRQDLDAPTPGTASTFRWAVFLAAVCVALVALVTVLLSLGYRAWAALLAYPALSLAAVTSLYFRAARGENPGPLLKGDRAPWLQPLFLPFRVVAWCVTVAGRAWRIRQPAVSDLGHGLYLGVRLFYPEARRLEALGVTCVLDVCAELPTNPRLARAPFERLQLPVLDRCPPGADEVERAAEWVAARLAEGKKVYVHCAFGRGRSAMVAAAVLLRLGIARDPDDAVAQLERARPVVHVKGHQYHALVLYARALARRGVN